MDPNIITAITCGKDMYDKKYGKQVSRAQKWINKNLFKKIKKAVANNTSYIIVDFDMFDCCIFPARWMNLSLCFFSSASAFAFVINQIDGLSAQNNYDRVTIRWGN